MKPKTESSPSIKSFRDIIEQKIGGIIARLKQNTRFTLNCDLRLLKLLSRPCTLYDIVKELGYARSSAHSVLHDYLEKGIVDIVAKQSLPCGLEKKYYKLTELGRMLLEVTEKVVEKYATRLCPM